MEAVEPSKLLKYRCNLHFFPEDGSPIYLRNKDTQS
jgi:hypothetical protein